MYLADEMYEYILKYGFFPESLEGVLSSEAFANWVFSHESTITHLDCKKSYKLQRYKSTRNNNAPRYFGLIHPEAYCRLAYVLRENWDEVQDRLSLDVQYGPVSMLRPRGEENSRLFSLKMSYGMDPSDEAILLRKQIGAKVVALADITNCFASIYTHSIPWAVIGKVASKLHENQDESYWFNQLDIYLRKSQDNETIGISIGSDVSNIIAELILSQIDNELSDYQYVRYIDDYYCYCKDRNEAEQFIVDLAAALEEYRLSLNIRKTQILDLPQPLKSSWVRSVRQLSRWSTVDRHSKQNVIDFLDYSSELFLNNPDQSPIRFAVKTLLGKEYSDYDAYTLVLQYILNLCSLYPYIIDLIKPLIDIGLENFVGESEYIIDIVKEFIEIVLQEHARYARSDALVYAFSYAVSFDIRVDQSILSDVIALCCRHEDYTSMLFAYLYCKKNGISVDFINIDQLIERSDAWLLSYEYSRMEGLIIKNSDVLERMRKDNISFLQSRFKFY